MSTRADIWMPIYIGDYMSDTMHLTTEQHGAYLLLLMAAWKANGNLPVSDKKLSVIARLTEERWHEIKDDILEFFDLEDGYYTQKRLKSELSRARRYFESRRENGRKGGRPPKETEKKPTGSDQVNRDHNRDHNRAETPSQSHSKKDSSLRSESKEADPARRVFDHWRKVHNHPQARLDDKRRKAINKALSLYNEDDLLRAIEGYRNSPHHMGENESGTVYDALTLILRDAEHIDRGLKFYEQPPKPPKRQGHLGMAKPAPREAFQMTDEEIEVQDRIMEKW